MSVMAICENSAQTVIIEIREYDDVDCIDLDSPIRGRCVDTGEPLVVRPWQCDVELMTESEYDAMLVRESYVWCDHGRCIPPTKCPYGC